MSFDREYSMITQDEAERIRGMRQLVEDGREDLISDDQRQWVLDVFKREGIAITMDMYASAAQSGFDVEGLEVNHES